MMITTWMNTIRDRMDKRRRYNAKLREISALSNSDLADMNGNVTEMVHKAYKEIYG